MNPFAYLGKSILYVIETIGGLATLFFTCLRWTFKRPFRWRLVIEQMENIGVNSLPVVMLTGVFTGMVLAYQIVHAFDSFGAQTMTGMVVMFATTRELGPVLASIMVTARSGSAMAAEIGTMRVTEQIDALHALAIEPIQYLMVPRIIAGAIVMPMLNVVTILFSMLGAYFVSVYLLDVNSFQYTQNIVLYVDMADVLNGTFKAFIFGIILTLVGCYKGYTTKGGALGVGRATTESVVLSGALILCVDYIITSLTL